MPSPARRQLFIGGLPVHEQLNHLHCRRHDALPTADDDLYLLLDGALLNAPRLAYENDSNPQLDQLYQGTRHASAIDVSPCLVKPSANSQLWTAEHQWKASGIVIQTKASMAQLADHLRSLISVRLPSGQFAYLRHYSPEWLLRLLKSCTVAEVSAFAGPASAWMIATGEEWLQLLPEHPGEYRHAHDEGWFSISPAQLDEWKQQEQARFLERMVRHFGCTQDEPRGQQQRSQLAQMISQAGHLGFNQEHLCIHYLELTWAFPDKMTSKSIVSLLSDPTQSGSTRLRQAEEQIFGLAREA